MCKSLHTLRKPLRQMRLAAAALFVAEPVEEQLFVGLVLRTHHVAHRASAHEMTNFFREVLRVIARSFQGVGHEQYLHALPRG